MKIFWLALHLQLPIKDIQIQLMISMKVLLEVYYLLTLQQTFQLQKQYFKAYLCQLINFK